MLAKIIIAYIRWMLDQEDYKRNLDENLVDDEEKLSPLFKVGDEQG